ncbi:MAG: glycerophosphodiester phosphodiesterase family protein, partial [Pseudomonadota bacterium]
MRTIANIKAAAPMAVLALCAVSCGASDEASKSGSAGELARFIDTSTYETAAGYLSCLEGRAVVVSAHRGGPAPGYPENAVETFVHTLSQVPALIETDVRETKDGVLVLMHDDTVDRTTTGTGAVASMTLQAIKDLYLVDNEG